MTYKAFIGIICVALELWAKSTIITYSRLFWSSKRFRGNSMATAQKYSKPCMTNMPRDVGTQIFKEILSSSPPDPVKMNRELDRYEKRLLEERKSNGSGN